MNIDQENWRVIYEATDYEVSSWGRVRRCVADWQGKFLGKVLTPSYSRGYARYILRVDGRSITRSAHRLVCFHFNGPPPPDKTQCAHKDGNKENNRFNNLYWATAQENADDKVRHGTTTRGRTMPPESIRRGAEHWTNLQPERIKRGFKRPSASILRGANNHNAKLSDEDVIQIKNTPTSYGSGKALSERFGVSMGLISAIRTGRAWSHLT